MRQLTGKVVVITGAGGGIGRALAQRFAAAGAVLALSDVDPAAARETARQACGEDGARCYALDVTDRDAVAEHARQVRSDLGPANVMINNAGVAAIGDLVDLSWQQLDWIHGINVNGVLHGTRAFLPELVDSGDGHLVNISSLFGLLGVPAQSAYCAGKAYVRALTESVRQEMRVAGHRVGATVVHPGFVRTDFVRSGQAAGDGDAAALGDVVDRWVRTTPEQVADKVVRAVRKDRGRVLVGADAYLGDALARLSPVGYQALTSALTRSMKRTSDAENAGGERQSA
ncbi:SDR family NAD(P)-dependent oxidoreductase [Saccharopolyspora sp. HNM0986]|uniref:SDR family NAD(P)-dependent oxidoreductase n=1 Tax=Saccharopolyspora galaxeae TaxID=2781241 RepID=UPI00190965CA|nr:SDR family NAD(P)-dependent oxidoreductase [Saccharopolyspora sp. HNM0986]MBK0869721.1 SDR family NAD(P)-dependent oxidoreductase [Saccharopolyspora sp. HNM0986]